MTPSELLLILQRSCTSGATAIRSIVNLQPADGPGGKVFPPTYKDGTYAFEKRIVDGNRVDCVLLDSVQSQANRVEEALLDAYRAGRLPLPMFEMTVADHDITTLTVPHRVHDAIFRDSLWDGKPFRESENGKRLVSARAWSATPFFEFAPTVLLFGTWDSQSGGGVNTAKVARSLVSEIIAIDVQRGVRTSSRIDPLGIKLVGGVVRTDGPEMWRFEEPNGAGKKAKKGEKPSEINHGNVTPSITDPEKGPGGVTFREAVQTTVLSFTQLRKLRFPNGAAAGETRDAAGRTVIAALGLLAVTMSQEEGYQLRSRCHLIPTEEPKFELLGRTAKEIESLSLDSETALGALQLAVEAAAAQDLKWHPGKIQLTPLPDLEKLVAFSDNSVAVSEEE
jgi:CRISPR-associated protein Csb1